MNLVIVESPAKAKTINKYLGSGYKVIASFGHIRDLPSKNGSVLPDQDFAMLYEISSKSSKYVNEIVKYAKTAEEIILATDPDREGESISWHVVEVLREKEAVKKDCVFKRVAFNEITKKAVLAAMQNPRDIDVNLVNAQQARRVLDYLVGFNLSPLLWRKLPGCRSAGRVQSVALRLICDREGEIEQFVKQEYWDITIDLIGDANKKFSARLVYADGQKLDKFSIANQEQADDLVKRIKDNDFAVLKIDKKQQRRNPPAPFITSSLQQEASRKLGFSAKKTMQIAQKLYEGVEIDGETFGLITYMRTDGVNLSVEAVDSIRSEIKKLFGDNYLPNSSRLYKSKAKNAQEAHEAIRPTEIKYTSEKLANTLDKDQLKLYDLIWKRTMACQMESVVIDMVGVDIGSADKQFIARANGSTIAFDGFYKIYFESKDDDQEEASKILPPLKENEDLETKKIHPEQHFTEPPPRYSEASLVKKLEELGIGRPSTYATIISVLQDRKYATLDKKRFFPSDLGRLVTVFLSKYFKQYVEYDFTAELEEDLDKISDGSLVWKDLLRDFWKGFNSNVTEVATYKIGDIIEYVQQSLDFYLFGNPQDPEYDKRKKCQSCGNGTLSLKLGKYGAFLACSNYPDCTYKKSVSKSADSQEILNIDSAAEEPKILGQNNDGKNIYLKKGPYGYYVQLGEDASGKSKPKRSSIPNSMHLNDINLETANKLLNLPFKLANHSVTGEELLIGIGRFGPYIKYQDGFISIPKNIDPFALTADVAEEIIHKKELAKTGKASKVADKPNKKVKTKTKTRASASKTKVKAKVKTKTKTKVKTKE